MRAMNRLMKFFDNLRLREKFLGILLLAMILACTGTLCTQRIPFAAYDERLNQSSLQMISLFAGKIQAETENIEALSYRILADNVLQENLSIMKEKPPRTTAWINARSEVSQRTAYFSVWFSSALTVQLKAADGSTFMQSFGNAVTGDEITDERIAIADGRRGREQWVITGEEPVKIFLVRQVREIKNFTMAPLATMLIQLDLQSVVERCRKSMDSLGSPLSCAIYSGDTCLYFSDEQVRSLSGEGEDGYEKLRLDGRSALCVRYTASNGWRYVTLTDYSAIDANIGAATRMSVALSAATALLALALSAWLIGGILTHLMRLLDKFDAFAASGAPVPEGRSPYQTRRDEIGQLHRHFDKMTRDYDRLSRENEEKRLLLQETQLQLLRAQVRPHFLYNTLESIYCLAKTAKEERIAVMIESLGRMIRASLNDRRDIVTVAEDVKVVQEYMRIQSLRYGERLRVEYDVPEKYARCLIPAMTIQPLVENAIHHAAEEMLETCVIHIRACAVENGVDVIVEDNGPGLDEDILRKLDSGEIKADGLGIGMRNIHRRVQYAFSEKYGLRVECKPGCTRVIIALPGTKENGESGEKHV